MDQLDRIEDKIDKVFERLGEHSLLLKEHEMLHRKNTDDLSEHIRRTDLLEEKFDSHEKVMETEFEKTDVKMQEALIPMKVFKFIWKNAPKLAGFITAITALAGVLAYFFKGK